MVKCGQGTAETRLGGVWRSQAHPVVQGDNSQWHCPTHSSQLLYCENSTPQRRYLKFGMGEVPQSRAIAAIHAHVPRGLREADPKPIRGN